MPKVMLDIGEAPQGQQPSSQRGSPALATSGDAVDGNVAASLYAPHVSVSQPDGTGSIEGDLYSAGVAVLVVDDHDDMVEALVMLLKQYGCDVRAAKSATQALEVLRTFKATLVLLDISMPEVDGYEACRQIRRVHRQSLYIAALTGWAQQCHLDLAAEAGFDAHLTKPATVEALFDIIQRAMAATDA
jgi:CheY-like chemotaxis protein